MKKSLMLSTVAVLAASIIATSCVSTNQKIDPYTDLSNEINSQNAVINTMFDKNDYRVIGRVTGKSDYIYWNEDLKEYTGDSHKYGVLNSPDTMHIGKGFAFGSGFRTSFKATSALEIAKQNAYYDLIQNAYAMGADSVIEPLITVETTGDCVSELDGDKKVASKSYENIKYKVTVRAVAIQLKNN